MAQNFIQMSSGLSRSVRNSVIGDIVANEIRLRAWSISFDENILCFAIVFCTKTRTFNLRAGDGPA